MAQINVYVDDETELKIHKAAEKKQWTRAHYVRWATLAMLEKEAKEDARASAAKKGAGK